MTLRFFTLTALLAFYSLTASMPIRGQNLDSIATADTIGDSIEAPITQGRWVGIRTVRALWLEFYGDSMVIVNDRYPLDYELSQDSLIAWGDTTIIAAYQVSNGFLLLYTPDDEVITLSRQSVLARPLRGIWIGNLGTEDDARVQLRMSFPGFARWKPDNEVEWIEGTWRRRTRTLTFEWPSDSTEWVGYYDPEGNAIQFQSLVEDGAPVIFRRWFR